MSRYYSSSKPFEWMRKKLGIEKPVALPFGEWKRWDADLKRQRPIAFWLTETLPDDVLVLPGHGVPFYGVKIRIAQLTAHHEERCDMIVEACRSKPMTSAELVPVVFHKHVLDAHQIGFAAGELIAHVNYMLVQGRLRSVENPDGILRFTIP